MNFGQAIEALKAGKRVAREGWENSFVFQQVPATIYKETIPKMQSLPQDVKDYFELVLPEDGRICYSNQLVIVSEQNVITGWAPSPSDVLARDWVIL